VLLKPITFRCQRMAAQGKRSQQRSADGREISPPASLVIRLDM
jgi:hypothetical protein